MTRYTLDEFIEQTRQRDRGSGESIQMLFRGDGFVVIQPKEEVYFQGKER